MSLYPVVLGAGDAFAGDGLMIAVRLADVAPPLRGGRCWRLMAHRRWLSGGLSGSGRARRRCSARSWRPRRRSSAVTARKGRRAGQPVRPREISHARTRRAVTAAVRAGRTCYQALTREIAKHRTIVDRDRHHGQRPGLTSTNRQLPAVTKPANQATKPKHLNPVALGA